MTKIVFPARYYADAALFASTEETRYYLNGVALTNHGHLVATDGHRMFVGNPAAAVGLDCLAGLPAETIILPLDKAVLSAARKPAKVCVRFLVVDRRGPGGMQITMAVVDAPDAADAATMPANRTHAAAITALIDGGFPDYRRAVPRDFDVKATLWFNGDFAADFARVAAGKRVGFRPSKDDGPMLVDLGRVDAFGVLMGMRPPTDAEPTVPGWFDPPAEAPAVEDMLS